ncbi:MAG TPA: MarR family transcriptional regulator [Gemmataceae bacterium]|nr:MarR family transcriptional regulator [Gemmataceae bacterium]
MDAWHEIAMTLRGAYLAMHRQADGEFARYAITADQFVVLAALIDGTVVAQSEVCRRTYADPNTMGAMLTLMETRGLVKRMRHPNDRRTRTVVLTPKGKRIFAKVWAGREATRDRMLALFTGEEVEALLGLLHRIIQELATPRGRGQRPKRRAAVRAVNR